MNEKVCSLSHDASDASVLKRKPHMYVQASLMNEGFGKTSSGSYCLKYD